MNILRLPLNEPIRSQCVLALRIIAVIFGIAVTAGYFSALSFVATVLVLMFAVPFCLLIALISAGVLLMDALRSLRDYETRLAAIAAICLGPAMMVIAIPLFFVSAQAGEWLGELFRLSVDYRRYEAIIAELRENPQEVRLGERYGVTHSVDLGPPVRVAFKPEGLGDNWSGIVHDPSGDVMLADGFDAQGRFHAPDSITKIFGGDLGGCRWLWEDYYSCSFT